MATTKTLTPTNETITIDAFQGEKPDHRHVADAETKLADAVNALNSKLTNKTEWLRIAEITTTENVNYDRTVSVTVPDYVSEIMFTLQRASNGRTFASTVVPWGQFSGGAIYAGGQYAIYSGTYTNIVNTGMRLINAVAIHVSNSSINIAISANDEAIRARIFVR